jgi:hypothetical protein
MSPRSMFLAFVAFAVSVGPVAGQSDKAELLPYFHFASPEHHIELEKTRGALDLTKAFTIELWVRWDTNVIDVMHHFAGDETWKGMSDKVTVTEETSGWVLRTSKVKDADKQSFEFNVATTAKKKRGWTAVAAAYQKVEADQWQHIAVCRSGNELRLYWNGKPVGRQSLAGFELHSAPSNLFLGVRKYAFEGREFTGDIRAFRISSKSRYGDKFKPDEKWEKDDKTIALLDAADATDASVPDSSGNKRDGLITGAKLVKPAMK